MNIIRCKDYNEVSYAAARIVAAQVKSKPNIVLGLPTGSTPVGLYQELLNMYSKNQVDFGNVTTFNLDEYYPIKRANNQSFYCFMYINLFSGINIKKENIYILNGETTDPKIECESYEKLITEHGGIDLQILGIGQNGHMGFNEPSESLESLTHISILTQNTIEANSRFFDSPTEVPTSALTMGIGTIMKARKIIILASGEEKREAVSSLIEGKIITQSPCTLLNAHRDVTLIVDDSALVSF